MTEVIVNENFSGEENLNFDWFNAEFDSELSRKLRLDAEKISSNGKIGELVSYPLVRKNLDFDFEHQRSGALRLLRDMNMTALLADEVGLGKTITTGIAIKEGIVRGFLKKIAIFTPPSLVNQWREEMETKFEISFKAVETEQDWEDFDFLLASIDKIKSYDKQNRRFRHHLAHRISWDLVVVDEAHKLKEKNTLRWKFIDRLNKKRFLLLTATPFQNDLIELYNLLYLLRRGHLGTLKEFKKNFIYRGNKRHPANAGKLKEKLMEVMIRRRRDEAGIRYTRRIPKIVSVELTREEKVVYENTLSLLKENYFRSNNSKIDSRLILFSILPKITSSFASAKESLDRIRNSSIYSEITRNFAEGILNDYKSLQRDSKAEKMLEIVSKIKKSGENEKILVYTRHPSTLKYLSSKLKSLGIRPIGFMGGLNRTDKIKRIRDFKNGAGDVLISTDTGAEGLNFQFCNNLINYDLPWNPMAVEQRIGRLDRIGQKKDIRIYSFATCGTMEEYIVDLIINKMCCVGLVIGELPIILFNLGLDEIEDKSKRSKIEERLMNAFIDSRGNLEVFSRYVKEIEREITYGIGEYLKSEESNKEFFEKILGRGGY